VLGYLRDILVRKLVNISPNQNKESNMAPKASAGMTMRQEFIDGMEFPINGVAVKWAYLDAPDTRFEHKYKVDLVLTKDQAEKMKAVGFKIKTDKDGDFVLTATKKTRTKGGKVMEAPRVVGRDGQTPFTEKVGNGSIINIKIFAKYTEVSGNTFLPAYINSVQVLSHVPFAGGFGNADDPDAQVDADDLPF
jgi:hypothetical protein